MEIGLSWSGEFGLGTSGHRGSLLGRAYLHYAGLSCVSFPRFFLCDKMFGAIVAGQLLLVYLGLPEDNFVAWHFLGTLTNDRPSAIYKIGNLRKGLQRQKSEHPFSASFGLSPTNGTVVEAQLGISVEPLVSLPPKSEGLESQLTNADHMTRFTRFAAENLFNYVASFARDSLSPSDPLVPLSAIKSWFDTMLHKLDLDPSFWKK
ncbi:hypothetical protein CLF_112408 [Clonorchis sinensis]|uniref:Uncharacterized protein n=1 Tax=Clonorchis sinensis TaxID=79923 RepID=G7YWD0_CLOSI|nr:hypothetical protein CLF_112408 [Clonorchis sinensis]